MFLSAFHPSGDITHGFLLFWMQEQYIFVYNAVLEALKVGNTVISCVDFCSEYERLCHIDPTKGKSGLLEQFEVC